MEPVTLAEAKLNARVDSSDEDSLFEGWIAVGRRWVENYTGLILTRREVTQTFDAFGRLRLYAWPIDPDTPVTLTYLDANGIEQTVGSGGYRLSTSRRPAALSPVVGACWPSALAAPDAITATFEAGYADPADVPWELKAAILAISKGLWKDRMITPDVEQACKAVCFPYRLESV
jgi:uncharacterized phiE125 gp8 family phage protein